MPKISVIMSSYNQDNRDLLIRSIDSILNQTLGDFEFLICHDGSRPENIDFLLKLSRKDPRIMVLGYEENKGLAYALNYCIKKARGQFFARQDDDDYSAPDRFQKQIEYLETHDKISFVGSSCLLVDREGNSGGARDLIEFPESKDFLWNSPFMHPTVMFRSNCFHAVEGYRVSPETIRGQDYDLFMTLFSKNKRGANMTEYLYTYTIPDKSKKYRPMAVRINEAKVRKRGFGLLGLYPIGYLYIIKPLIVGLLPHKIYNKLHS